MDNPEEKAGTPFLASGQTERKLLIIPKHVFEPTSCLTTQ